MADAEFALLVKGEDDEFVTDARHKIRNGDAAEDIKLVGAVICAEALLIVNSNTNIGNAGRPDFSKPAASLRKAAAQLHSAFDRFGLSLFMAIPLCRQIRSNTEGALPATACRL